MERYRVRAWIIVINNFNEDEKNLLGCLELLKASYVVYQHERGENGWFLVYSAAFGRH